MRLEATVLAEKELTNVTLSTGEEKVDDNVNARNKETEIIDKMLEDEMAHMFERMHVKQ